LGGLTTIKNLKWSISSEYINVVNFTTESSPNDLAFEYHDISKPNNNKIRLTHPELHADKPMFKNISNIMFGQRNRK
jgi:hypothetical protein